MFFFEYISVSLWTKVIAIHQLNAFRFNLTEYYFINNHSF